MENKYQITKTIRFKLDPQGNVDAVLLKFQEDLSDKLLRAKTIDNPEGVNSLKPLINKLEGLKKNIQNLIYAKEKNGGYKTNENGRIVWFCGIKIKYTWMRSYMKNAFYDNKQDNPPKAYSLNELDYVQTEFDNGWFPELDEIIYNLRYFDKTETNPKYEKQRYAQIALVINQLSKRSNFEFMKSFVFAFTATNKPDIDNDIDAIKRQIEEIEIELNNQKAFYLPYQSNGIQLAAGSFNYYTINKSPKMLGEEKSKLEKELNQSIYESKGVFDGVERFRIRYSLDEGILSTLNIKNELPVKSLNEAYDFLKKWKAEQKKSFMEAIQVSDDNKAKSIMLFKSSDTDYNTVKQRILKVQDLGKKINNSGLPIEEIEKAKVELKTLKSKKNDFFNTFSNNPQTPNYKQLCTFYKNVAIKRGELKTKIASIEKEKHIAEQVQYWCVVLDKNEHQYLYMIPRDGTDNIKKAKEYIERLKSTSIESPIKLHYFNSLTLSALRKLCFKENNNTFTNTIKNVTFPPYEQFQTEPDKIKFYQKILKNATTLNLDIYTGLDALCQRQFETLNDFEIELNKICYAKTICISQDVEVKLKDTFNAICFEITSQDIKRYLNDDIDNASDIHKNKRHTNTWRSFWYPQNERNQYPTRLNPEIRIVWREAKPSRIEKYGKETPLYDEKKKNRYLHPQYTLITTITENAHSNKINYAFADTKDKGEAILNYNEQINKGVINYAYGSDVGADDLALLTHINNNNKPVLFDAYEITNTKFEKTGYLKGGIQRDKAYKLIENPSYFLKKELYDNTFNDKQFEETFAQLFKKVSISSLDLTTAKVICGKLILNGDYATHQKLKILHAKRKISQRLKINPSLKLIQGSDDLYKLFIGEEIKGNIIYRSKEIYDVIIPFEDVKQDFFDFFDKQKSDDARLEDNINKTRASLVGNMVGVIDFLYNKHPGFIVLEDLKQSIIESHRNQFEGDITRPLEWALYRKFQSKGLVPPISELLKLRELEKFTIQNEKRPKKDTIKQFGIIKFESESETSLLCPKCGKKAYKSSEDEKYNRDKQQGIFECGCVDCDFNNKTNAGEYTSLDTNDKIAAFNIAKRGFENFK